MFSHSIQYRVAFLFIFFIALCSCSTLPKKTAHNDLTAYTGDYGESIERRHLPIFLVEGTDEAHNRIGTPMARSKKTLHQEVFIDPSIPSIYAETRSFATTKDTYTNVIYRIHFEKIPFSIVPFHLSAGDNVGVIVVVTLNSAGQPLLYTTVQTCGCFLSFTPTSYLAQESYPQDWSQDPQNVYGKTLPSFLNFYDAASDYSPISKALFVEISSHTHRIKNLSLTSRNSLSAFRMQKTLLRPLASLERLPISQENFTSFYEESGARKGYVKGSTKPWEAFLMSWWTLDLKIGQDKKLGYGQDDGPIFYTSLKPWDRIESDMRNFPVFLNYWGWKL